MLRITSLVGYVGYLWMTHPELARSLSMGFYSLFNTLNSFGLLIGTGTLNSPGLHFDYDTLSFIVLLIKGGTLILFGLLEKAGILRRQQSAQSLPAPTTYLTGITTPIYGL